VARQQDGPHFGGIDGRSRVWMLDWVSFEVLLFTLRRGNAGYQCRVRLCELLRGAVLFQGVAFFAGMIWTPSNFSAVRLCAAPIGHPPPSRGDSCPTEPTFLQRSHLSGCLLARSARWLTLPGKPGSLTAFYFRMQRILALSKTQSPCQHFKETVARFPPWGFSILGANQETTNSRLSPTVAL